MNPIIESLRAYGESNRWSVGGGPVQQLTARKLEFPLLWHEPLSLTGKKGLTEGTLHYKAVFHLLERTDGNQTDANEQPERLEKRALEAIATLENHSRVRTINLVSCIPARSPLTQYGETAVTVTVEAEILYWSNPVS